MIGNEIEFSNIFFEIYFVSCTNYKLMFLIFITLYLSYIIFLGKIYLIQRYYFIRGAFGLASPADRYSRAC